MVPIRVPPFSKELLLYLTLTITITNTIIIFIIIMANYPFKY